MAKNPAPPKKPGKTPKSKAHRPDVQPIGPALAELLNPAINRGDAGMGSGTGLKPPPDNSWDRRAGGEAAAHRARASTRGKSEDVAKRDTAPAMPLRPNPQPPGARSFRPPPNPSPQQGRRRMGFRGSPAGELRHLRHHPDARSGTGAAARPADRRGRRRSAGASAAQQDGGVRRQGDRRCAGVV